MQAIQTRQIFWFHSACRNVLYISLFVFTLLAMSENLKADKISTNDPDLLQWKKNLWPEAKALGIQYKTFKSLISAVQPDYKLPRVRTHKDWARISRIEKQRQSKPLKKGTQTGEFPASCYRPRQKEFLFPTSYFPPKHLNSLIRRGKVLKRKYSAIFRKIESDFGVDVKAVLGIWGRETAFGIAKNRYDGIRTLLSLAYAGPAESRKDHRSNLLIAMKFIDDGHISARNYKTSFAGATGYPQFTPDVFEKYATDADGDGRKNIWTSVPDAVASTARYLKGIGWQTNQPWGYEVQLPAGFNCSLEGPKSRMKISEWKKLGVRRVNKEGGKTPGFPDPDLQAQFMAPAGMKGPKFLVFENFEVFRRYNKADLYALFVGHLGDQIYCNGSNQTCNFKARWPVKDHFNFSRKRICEMQIHLQRLKASDEIPDGLFGGKTRRGIGNFEKSIGQKTSCFPSRSLLKILQTKSD